MALGDTNESLEEIEDNMKYAEDKDETEEEDEQKGDGAETCSPGICKHPRHKRLFWIACDVCLQWFHGFCVGIS